MFSSSRRLDAQRSGNHEHAPGTVPSEPLAEAGAGALTETASSCRWAMWGELTPTT